jgi:transcriptional regulator with XRE-family HTH domain
MPRSIGWYLPYLESWRKYRVLSTTELAEKSGVSLSVLSRLEHQKGRAGTKTIDKLCEVLRTTREELLYQDPYEGKGVPAAA